MTRPGELDPKLSTRLEFERTTRELVDAAARFPTATLLEANAKRGALPSAIKAVTPGLKAYGPALTVHSPGGDNLWLHRAIYVAQPGDVLVVYCSGQYEHGYWGEIMTAAAQARGVSGLMIDGCVRDSTLLGQARFPVFARGCCIRGTGKDFGALGWINHPVLIDDVIVRAGDLVAADEDGVVVIARPQVAAVLAQARQREDQESGIVRELQAGATTLDLYGWSRDGD